MAEQKLPWSKRREIIKKQFPSIDRLDWQAVFKQDPAVAGKIINDILKADVAEPGRPGKRPSLDNTEARIRVNQIRDDDYTVEAFHRAATLLKGDRSIRHFSNTTGINKDVLVKLLKGSMEPTIEHMEKMAKGVKRHPSYFLEYRIAYVTKILVERMNQYPEASIVQYTRVRDTMREGLKQ